MLRPGILPSSTASDDYQSQRKATIRSISDTEAGSGATLRKTLEPFQVQNLGRAYRTESSNSGIHTAPKTRAEEAAEIFNGFMSSDSDDSDDSDDAPLKDRKTSADRIDQHKAANRPTNPSGRKRPKIVGGDSAVAVSALDDQAIKKERSANPSLPLKQSERSTGSRTLFAAPEAEHVSNLRTEANHLMPNLEAVSTEPRKRANSTPPSAPRTPVGCGRVG